MDEINLDIQDVIRILKIRWKLIILLTIISTVVVGIVSFFAIKPVYQANTKVFVGKDVTKEVNYNNNDIEMYQKLLKTYAELVKTNDLIENAISKKNLDITAPEVNRNLIATPRIDTQILEISYENNDNVMAKEVLVTVIDEFVEEAKMIIPNGTVKVIESAELPRYPISPNNTKNLALGFFGGIILGIIVSLLMEYKNNTFKTKEQIERVMGISVIGVIPLDGAKCTRHKFIKKEKNKRATNPVYEN